MPTVSFGRAVRRGTHVIITAYGESGCGKTYSLIKLGRGLVGPKGRVGMLDTETGRGLIYASVAGGYDYAELTPPFTPERYIEAIDAAEEAGIEALIIDSGSHEWEGLGGVLEIADAQTSRQGKALEGLVKWAKPKARHKRYVQRLLNSRMHLLISLRAKEKMVQLTDKTPIPQGAKIGDIISAGYVPIQDKRFIFETTVQLFLPVSTDRHKLGIPIVEKCPEDLWGAFPAGAQISEETGRQIAEWVGGAAPVDGAFERLKRAAEEAAGGGAETLHEHWRGLDKPSRDRLLPHGENLRSIAAAADREQDDRRREREDGHRAFRPAAPEVADERGGPAPEEANEDPFGLPRLKTPETASPPAGDRHGEALVANAESPNQPPRRGEPPPPARGERVGAPSPPRSAIWQEASYAIEPPVVNATGAFDWPQYGRSLAHLAGEATEAEIAKLRADNKPHLDRMRRESGDDYRELVVAFELRVADLKVA